MNRRIDTVLLDLDGTLLDTHRDLCGALNIVLERHGRQPLPSDIMRPFVSQGAMVMVCLAFKCHPGSDVARGYWQEMLDAYEENIAATTILFPGMETVLDKIESTGRNWGIVTNKPGYFTEKLLAQLELPWKPQSVVSGDTLTVKKPSPEPLLRALADIGVDAEYAAYVGDDSRDVQAGKSAGMMTIAAAYGYYVDEDPPSGWGADALIDNARELLDWLP